MTGWKVIGRRFSHWPVLYLTQGMWQSQWLLCFSPWPQLYLINIAIMISLIVFQSFTRSSAVFDMGSMAVMISGWSVSVIDQNWSQWSLCHWPDLCLITVQSCFSHRPELYGCQLFWKDERTLLVGWADRVKVRVPKLGMPQKQQLTWNWSSCW